MLVIALALGSAAMSALSSAGEQRVASRVAAQRWRARGAIGFALALLSTPLWLGSWVTDAASFFVQAAALHLGSLTVVQPLMVTVLLFSLPLAAASTGRRVGASDWTGAVLICTGLVAVLATRGSSGPETASGPSLLVALGGVLVLVVALAALARHRWSPVRAALLSVAAGALFAVDAALTKLTAAIATTEGFRGLVTSWPGYALAVVSIGSFALQQAAFANGPLATAVAAAVITDPLAAYLIGVVGFSEALPRSGPALALAAVGMIVLAVGVGLLARSPLLHPRPAPVEEAIVEESAPVEPAPVETELLEAGPVEVGTSPGLVLSGSVCGSGSVDPPTARAATTGRPDPRPRDRAAPRSCR